jgi:cell division protein FtsL
MNWLKYLVGFSALIIAGCAAFFSVTGLGVLFSGASTAVMVMAGALEFAKLVAATYLKQMWGEIKGFNKWYLVSAVALLMLITSAGIFGYLSNAFQAQSLKLQQVDREIMVHSTKIDQNTTQITQLSTQISEFNKNQGKIIDGGKVNSRLLRSIDNRDKEIAKINKKISDLQDQNAKENEKINEIKTSNIDLEKEVGGFRFVAEAFGVELKNVVKFFIFLIVIVFDPLAVALIIAFNGLIDVKKKKREDILGEMIENNQKMGLYEVYGDDIINETEKNEINKTNEITSTNTTDVVANSTPNDEDIEETPSLKWEEFMHPDFQWQKRNLWINNPKAVNYWLKSKGGSVRELVKIKNEEENIKTY